MKDLIARIEELAIENNYLIKHNEERSVRELDYLNQIEQLKESLKTMICISRDYEIERDKAYDKISRYNDKYGELNDN